jgi:hypothetical protein
MKTTKFLLFVLLLALAVCMPSWSQISFYSYGRVVVTPLAFTKNEQSGTFSAVSAATSTWGDVPRIGFSANGTAPSGNAGFNLDFDFGIDITNNNNIAIIGANAKAWFYPLGLLVPERFNMLKLLAGWFEEDELRGKIGATEFGSWLVPNGSKDEDYIFTRIKASAGAYARLEPLKWWDSPWNQLTLHAAIGSNAIGANGNKLRAILNLYNNEANRTEGNNYYREGGWSEYDGNRNTSAADVYRAGQYAIGYRIPNVGLARFQFIGSNRNVFRLDSLAAHTGSLVDIEKRLVAGIDRGDATKNGDVLEFAFLYDGLEGLKVDAGVKLPQQYTTKISFTVIEDLFMGYTQSGVNNPSKGNEYTVQLPNVVALGLNWTPSFLPELNIMSRFDFSFGGKIERADGLTSIENGYVFGAWFVPSYKIIPNLTLGFDFGMDLHGEDKMIRTGVPDSPALTAITGYTDFGLAPWVEMAMGGARARIGVVVMLPGSPRFKPDVHNKVTPKFLGDPVISLPISMTYSF